MSNYPDNQAAFDRIKQHLLSQMERSALNGKCLYRGPDGLKCAVGCLIDDEHYNPDMEGWPVSSLTVPGVMHAVKASGYDANPNLLEELQAIHDLELVCNWAWALRMQAQKWGLTP